MAVKPGDTFYNFGHLWVIVVVAPGPPETAIVASLTSRRDGSDATTLLRPGDHPFVVHDTVVSYADLRSFEKSDLEMRIDGHLFRTGVPFSRTVLQQIQSGLLKSPFTPRKFKMLFEGLFGEDAP